MADYKRRRETVGGRVHEFVKARLAAGKRPEAAIAEALIAFGFAERSTVQRNKRPYVEAEEALLKGTKLLADAFVPFENIMKRLEAHYSEQQLRKFEDCSFEAVKILADQAEELERLRRYHKINKKSAAGKRPKR